MGLFGHSKERSPLRDDFARLLMNNLRRRGETRAMQYRPDDFALVLGEDQVSLESHCQRLFEARPEDHDAAMQVIGDSLAPPHQIAAYPAVERLLLPTLRSRLQANNRALHLRAHGIDAGHELIMPFAGELVVGVVIDYPHLLQPVVAENLSRWGVAPDAVHRRAIKNLARDSRPRFEEIDNGIFQSAWCDAFDAARLLLPDLFRHLGAGRGVAVMATNSDRVLATSAEDPQRVMRMVELGEHFVLNEGKPLAPEVLQLAADAWHVIQFSPDHPAHDPHQNLVKTWMENVYAEQQCSLRQLYADENRDPFIATYSVARRGPRVESYAAWTEGVAVSTWLPQVDTIVLVPEDGEPNPVPWSRLTEVCGPLPRVDMVAEPARFDVSGFPSLDQIKKLVGAGE